MSLLASAPARGRSAYHPDQRRLCRGYKAKYQRIATAMSASIIDGISIAARWCSHVPMNKRCADARGPASASPAKLRQGLQFGIKVTSSQGTSELSYYPDTVKDWIRRNGG